VTQPLDSQKPAFWEERYRTERLPWDLGGVPAELVEALSTELRPPGRVLIPGCGSGYEVRSFLAAGWEVCAIDFSSAAVARAQKILGAAGACVRLGDFFAESFPEPFDLVYDRTFLCSLSPVRWPQYVERVASLLRPSGRLAGIFFYGEDPEPPPYPLSFAKADRLFGPRFRRCADRPIAAAQALPVYGGGERWQIWERLPAPTP
jgi:thiopurine S-methyltransferase